MKRVPLVLVAATLAATSFSWIQKEDKSNLARAKQYVTRTNSAIKRANSILGKSTEQSAIESATKQFDNATELLGKAKEFLDAVSAGFSGKSEVETDFNAAKTDLENLGKQLKGAGENLANTDKTIQEGADKDGPAVEALTELLPKVAANIRGTNTDIELIRAYPQMKADAIRLNEKYGKRGSRGGDGDTRMFSMRAIGLKNDLASVESAIQKFSKDGPKIIGDRAAELKQRVDADVAEKRIPTFGEYYSGPMAQLSAKSEMYALLCKELPGYDAGVRERAVAAVKYIEESLKKLENEVIKANVPPTEKYTGGDKAALAAQLSKAYQSRYPNAKVIKVVITGESWSRTVAWKWRNDGWYREDTSVLGAYVLIKGQDPAHIYMIGCQFVKDHMAGGQTTAVIPLGVDKPNANFILLASKVK